MREAVIVSTARTPIGKAYRGAFNDTQAQTLGGHVIASALKRASVEGGEVDDVVMGAALQQGSQGGNVARQCAVARRPSDQRRRHVGRPAMRLGPDGDRHRRQGDRRRRHERHRRRRARIDFAGPERQDEPLLASRTPGSSSIATTSTCRCSRPPRSSPSATRSRASAQDEYGAQSQARTAAGVRPPAGSTPRSRRCRA